MSATPKHDTDAGAKTELSASAAELLNQCQTVGNVKALHNHTVSKEQIEGGDRIREVKIRVFDRGEEVVHLESDDKLVYIRNGLWKQADVWKVGDDISDTSGMHALTKRNGDEQPLHLSLIQQWLQEDRLLIVGTREVEYANFDDDE